MFSEQRAREPNVVIRLKSLARGRGEGRPPEKASKGRFCKCRAYVQQAHVPAPGRGTRR